MTGLAVYPGSFDPPTLGHLDMIERASRLFDSLIVAVGKNSAKRAFFSHETRLAVLRETVAHLPTVKVAEFDGLLVDFALGQGAGAIVRGLRATADFEYEFQLAMVNRRLQESLESVFLMTTWEYSYLSSSIVREVAELGGDYSAMVPPAVAKAIAARLGEK